MQMNAPGKSGFGRKSLLCFLLIFMGSAAISQSISLSLKNAALSKAFKQIELQSPYRFSYAAEALEGSHPVTVELKNETIETALKAIFFEQPLQWSIDQKFILVRPAEKQAADNRVLAVTLSGSVLGEDGEPIGGATVTHKQSGKATATDKQGRFQLENVSDNTLLIVSSIGYQSKEVKASGASFLEIRLSISVSKLDETVVIAYGTTTNRLNTGSVSKVPGDEISKQPVSNPLAALEGRVPGMLVTQSTGLPGSAFKVQIRGRTALDLGLTDDEPLFVIDGIPFAPNNGYLNSLTSALGTPVNSVGVAIPGGLSPFNSLNPQDIESIEVLKDADATAIYGSRGANGVVLITTKKGKAGKTVFSLNFQTGSSQPTRTLDFLNTQQYVQMRKQAFSNDSAGLTNANAFDLLVWDTSRYTDLKRLLIGNTAHNTDVQASVSGGTATTQFLVRGSYHKESTVFPAGLKDNRGTLHFNVNHLTAGQKLKISLSGSYSSDHNQLIAGDPTSLVYLPPHIQIYDFFGKLAWNEGGIFAAGYNNPLASLQQSYATTADNLISNLQLSYDLTKDILLRVNAGYNNVSLDEIRTNPLIAQNPMQNPVRSATFGNNSFKSWIIEPQALYTKNISKGRLEILLGSSWQHQSNTGLTTSGSGYFSDDLLNSLSGATSITGSRTNSEYRYEAFFGRVNYNLSQKYILNLSARRDGSSKFGPGKQFANFSAVGLAWIFSKEKFIGSAHRFLSFGKLRGSYGSTGNDKIANYQYLDTWSPTFNPYQGGAGLNPTKLFNPDYRWEKTTKLELGLDLGFAKDRWLFSAMYYRNQSSNQLVQYKMPYTTGFTSIVQNLPALVQNTGVEFSFSSIIIRKTLFSWTTSANLTLPKTKLVRFPNLSSSSYANQYVIGQPLNVIYGYRFTGINPVTGLYTVEDRDKDNVLSSKDYQVSGSLDPQLYGGLNNHIEYKNFQLDIFIQFTKQKGKTFTGVSPFPPGSISNMPLEVLNAWQKPADQSTIQRFTQGLTSGTPAFVAFSNFRMSDGIYSDASFGRLKTVSLSYNLPEKWMRRIKLNSCRFYLSGQNLLTLTNYDGGDPETQNYLRLPPLKTITGGIQFTF
jgi:TonB-dependent starch-binding outer membrane protein SusC